LIAGLQGDHDRSRELYEEYLRAAQAAGWDHAVATVLSNLAVVAREQGDPRRAAQLELEAIDLLEKLRDPSGLALSFWGAAYAARSAGDPERAARLLGAAEALRERTDSPVLAFQRPEYDGYVSLARHGLGDDAFAAARAQAAALPLEEAVAEAKAALAATVGIAPEAPPPQVPAATHGLSPRELDVVRLVAEGRSNREIADALSISPRTATTRVRNVLKKLGFDSRTAVAAWAIRHNLA
jgi:non-specific serine/threonine protein kinase